VLFIGQESKEGRVLRGTMMVFPMKNHVFLKKMKIHAFFFGQMKTYRSTMGS
jgi:hypothetical protein